VKSARLWIGEDDGEYFSGVGGWQGERKATGLSLVWLWSRQKGRICHAPRRKREGSGPASTQDSGAWLASLRR
jgi:hypothetical protein